MRLRGTLLPFAVWVFAATASAAELTITLQELTQFSTVYSINDDDLIAGTADGSAVIGKPGEAVTAIAGGLDGAFPRVINADGQVAGEYSVPGLGGRQAFFYDPDVGTVDLFVAGTLVYSSTINDLGQTFWVTTTAEWSQWMNVRDPAGQITSIAVPSGTAVIDANGLGQALSWNARRVSGVTTFSGTTLSHLQIEDPNALETELRDINNLGQAVGRLALPSRAALWDADGGLRELLGPGEAEGFDHAAAAINDHGLVALTLTPHADLSSTEFAFYSPDEGLIRLEQPEFQEPAACAPGTFRASTYAGVGITPARDATLNDLGQALVRIRLRCRVGHDSPFVEIPGVATVEGGIRLLPLPRGLRVDDLFEVVVDELGRSVNVYDRVDFVYGALNNRGKVIGNFRAELWDGSYVAAPLLYDLLSEPVADLRVDGQDEPLTVSAGQSVHVTLSFDPGGRSGEAGEYWAALYSSLGSFLLFDVQAELTELEEVTLVDAPLPVAWYVFLFNVEDTPDGAYQSGWLDYAIVVVTP